MLKRARQYGYESTVMRPVNGGNQRQMVQAIVVSAEEIENNPAFAEIREREGLGEGTSGVIYIYNLNMILTQPQN